jgi:hypothetical protein
MSTVITTINDRDMTFRLCDAAFALRAGKKVVMKPGVLRASGWTASRVIKFILEELEECERYTDNDVIWKVWITRRPVDHALVIEATCIR